MSAAIYSARKGLKVTLIADRIGGQVKDTMDIENLISVSKTTGPKLTGAMQAHMDDYDITEDLRGSAQDTPHLLTPSSDSGKLHADTHMDKFPPLLS